MISKLKNEQGLHSYSSKIITVKLLSHLCAFYTFFRNLCKYLTFHIQIYL